MTGAEGEPVRGLPPIHESLLPREHALHRPRHGRRQRAALTCALVFFLVPALAFVFGVRPQAFENRRLAAFPGVAGWGFFTGLPNWATDHLPLRQAGVRAETGLSEGLFGEPPAFSRTDRQPSGAPIGPIALPPSPDVRPPGSGAHVDFAQVVEGSDGWLYFAEDASSKCQPNRPLSDTIAALRRLRSEVESSGRSFVLVVAPDKTTVLPGHLPADYPDRQCALAAAGPFWSAVTSQAGALDLRAGLRALSTPGTTPIYYPQDTHWTDLGSLDLLRSIADRIQPGVSISWRTAPDGVVTRPADLPPLVGQSGVDLGVRYSLRPDGTHDLTGPGQEDLTRPVHFGTGRPVPGMITEPVTLLGDSFLERSTPYLPAVFSDATAVAYSSLVSQPDQVQAALVSSHIVVVEVVERDLANGSAQILQPAPLAAIGTALASHPVR